MKCNNINHPNFKAINDVYKDTTVTNVIINNWQNENKSTDIPTLEQLKDYNTKKNVSKEDSVEAYQLDFKESTKENWLKFLQEKGLISKRKFVDGNYYIVKGSQLDSYNDEESTFMKNNNRLAKIVEDYKPLTDNLPLFDIHGTSNSAYIEFNTEAIQKLNDYRKQKQGVPDEQLDSRIREFLNKFGIKVNIDSVLDKDGNPIPDVVARAKYVRNNMSAIIDICSKKQGYDTLTEEATHFLVWMMRGTPLYNSMINDVVKTNTYKQVKNGYGAKYPSETLLREEAMVKLITESVIYQAKNGTKLSIEDYNNEMNRINRWFNRVMEFLRDLLAKYSVSPYDLAAMKLLFKDVDNLSLNSIKDEKIEAYQLDDVQSAIDDVIQSIKSRKIHRDEPTHTYTEGDYKYKQSVTETIDKGQFPDRTKQESLQDEAARVLGTAGHADFNNSLLRAVEMREHGAYSTRYEVNTTTDIRAKIDVLVEEILNSYGDKARFLTEPIIGDKATGIAGGVDLIVVFEQNGKPALDILDFKFTQFKREGNKIVVDEMPMYKKKQYMEQLEGYKEILLKAYGVKYNINASLIPIDIVLTKIEDKYQLKSMEMGSLKYQETKPHLNLIPLETNQTGNKTIDDVLKGLIAQKKIIEASNSSDPVEQNKRANRLKAVSQAIKKILLTKDLTSFFEEMNAEFNTLLSGELTADKVEAVGELIPYFKNINFTKYLNEFAEDEEKLLAVKSNIDVFRNKLAALEDIYNDNLNLVAEKITDSLGVKDINIPQEDIGFWAKYLSYFSNSQNPHIQALYKLWIKAKDTARNIYEKQLTEIESLTEGVKKYAERNGINMYKAFDFMLNTDKYGNLILINKYSKESISAIENAKANKDYDFIKKHTTFDVKKYEERYAHDKAFYMERYKDRKDRDKIVAEMLKRVEVQYDVRKSNYALINNRNYYLKLDESKLELSPEYKHIQNTPELKAFYDYFINTMNSTRKDLGLDVEMKFVPQIMKSVIESISTDGVSNTSFSDRFWQSVSTSEQGSFGEVNVLTGKVEYKVSMPYQAKLGKDASKDLGKVLALWVKAANDTVQLREVETSAKLLLQHLEKQEFFISDAYGNPKKQKGSNQLQLVNAENSNTVKAYIEYMQEAIYKINIADGKVIDKVRKRPKLDDNGDIVKDENGKIVMEEYVVPVSVEKVIQKILSYISSKALGLNIISAGANLGGGLANGYYIGHDGRFYNKSQFTKAIKLFGAGSLNPQTKALLRYFDITGNMEGFNKANALSVSAADKFLTYDKIYALQKKGDELIHNTILLAMLQSHGLDTNGKIKPLNKLPENTKSLLDSTEIDGDNIKIKGLTDAENNQAYLDFRRKVHEVGKKIMGVSPDHDIRLINQTIGGRILMQFRNWLPKMAEERFMVGTRYNQNVDEFERGRYISFMSFIYKNAGNAVLELAKAGVGLGADYDTILSKKWELLDYSTKQKFLNNTSSEQEAKASFIALEKGNIKSTLLELQLMAFLGAVVFLFAGLGDDDDDLNENPAYRYAVSMSDRLFNEVSFFVVPSSFLQIIKSPVASSSTLNDAWNIISDLSGETVGRLFGNEEMIKRNKPLKRIGKLFPLLKEGIKDIDIMFGEDYLDNIK